LRRIVKSPQAVADLEDLWLESIQRFGFPQADSFILSVHRRFEPLADNPGLGVARPEIGPGLRLHFQPAPLVIAYRSTADELRILRIFHGRRRYEALLRT
jgi:toxin ParE1/3/4